MGEPADRGQPQGSILIERLKHSDIENALSFIPSDERDLWVKMGMAIKSELGDIGFPIWDYWSQSSSSYREQDAKDVWRSIQQGSIGIGTLIFHARLNGWQQDDGYKIPVKTKPKSSQQQVKSTSAYGRKLWLTADWRTVAVHPYAINKGINWHAGAGRGIASGKVIGRDADCIIIPIRDLTSSEVIAVQCINAEGKKQTFGNMSGAALVLGNTLDTKIRWYVVEGWADAVTMVFHTHDGNAVAAAAFGKGRMINVAEALDKRYRPELIQTLEDAE